MSERFLTRAEATAYLVERLGRAITARTLQNLAARRRGPVFSSMVGRAMYRPADLDRWLAEEAARPSRKGRPRKARATLTASGDDQGKASGGAGGGGDDPAWSRREASYDRA